ncbi:hypothetical protein [Promicromonospora sp. NPDC059942]|uniref:hypothetical protein n=1 Tax=Promicromonospora sp. NPDC059942 TaxID=3347009 RepID=UPI0036529CDC
MIAPYAPGGARPVLGRAGPGPGPSRGGAGPAGAEAVLGRCRDVRAAGRSAARPGGRHRSRTLER